MECAKDKVWGTGIVLSRDDWHDITLWESQGILGEMLTEIRDSYLGTHPNVQVQPLSYEKKIPHTASSNDFGRGQTLSAPMENLYRSRSNPDVPVLLGVPNSSLAENPSVTIPHTSSHPNLLLLQHQTTGEEGSTPVMASPLLTTASHTLQAVLMDQAEAPAFAIGPSTDESEAKVPISHTQAALLSLSQTPQPMRTVGVETPGQQRESNG